MDLDSFHILPHVNFHRRLGGKRRNVRIERKKENEIK